MTRHHLTDTELLAQHFDRRGGDVHEHLALCATCQERGRAITELLDDVNQATAGETDALFGPESLARQQARIMGRIAHECRSARIISFPAASPPPVRHARTGTRWVAAAVAAGVILGIVGEHMSPTASRARRIRRGASRRRKRRWPRSRCGAVTDRTVSASDDEFYGQVELAFGSSGPAALRSLDALTPRASDVRE